jgi:hypothetical protein
MDDQTTNIVYSDDAVNIRSSSGALLDWAHKSRGCRNRMGPAGALSLWSHECGSVLTSVDRRDFVFLIEDPTPLLRIGVVDERRCWASVIQKFGALLDGTSSIIPFFTADDPFDLSEALCAVQAHFGGWNDDGMVTGKVWSSYIPSHHTYKYDFQGRGWFDVTAGFWGGGDLREYSSHDAYKERHRRHLAEDLRVKCLVLQNIENIEICDFGVTSNFVCALDDAISLVNGWDMRCAVAGTPDAWWALRSAFNGPSKFTFQRIHIPSDKGLTSAFMRTMQLTFSGYTPLSADVLSRVYEIAQGKKDRALILLEHLAGKSYGRDSAKITVEDIEEFCGEQISIAPAEMVGS